MDPLNKGMKYYENKLFEARWGPNLQSKPLPSSKIYQGEIIEDDSDSDIEQPTIERKPI